MEDVGILPRCTALLSAQKIGEARIFMTQTVKELFDASAVSMWGRDETNEHFVELAGESAMSGDGIVPCDICEERYTSLHWAFQQVDVVYYPQNNTYLLQELQQIFLPFAEGGGFILLPCVYQNNVYSDALFMIVCSTGNISEIKLAWGANFADFCAAFIRMKHGFDRADFREQHMARVLNEDSKRQKRQEIQSVKLLESRFIGSSRSTERVRDDVLKYAPSALSVLITGETGTGKELVAQSLHQFSSLQGKFIPVNMAALPENLIESELFGFVKGAFTGADRNHIGLFAEAQDGTLFLDEIGDMPLGLQAKLLRVLQEKKYRPLGASRELSCNARIIAATHKNIDDLIKTETFRTDLYYRIAEGRIALPPLRERIYDIGELSTYFLSQASPCGEEKFHLSENAHSYLMQQVFPGNIRQLRSVLRDACLSADINFVIHTDAVKDAYESSASIVGREADPKSIALADGLTSGIGAFEKMILTEALTLSREQRKAAAQKLRLPLRTFYNKIKKYGLEERGHD